MTEIGTVDVKLNVPRNGFLPAKTLNGAWSRKLGRCSLGFSVRVPAPKSAPVSSVKTKLTDAGWLFGFAKATPVFTVLFTSAYMRADVRSGEAGTPASVTTM